MEQDIKDRTWEFVCNIFEQRCPSWYLKVPYQISRECCQLYPNNKLWFRSWSNVYVPSGRTSWGPSLSFKCQFPGVKNNQGPVGPWARKVSLYLLIFDFTGMSYSRINFWECHEKWSQKCTRFQEIGSIFDRSPSLFFLRGRSPSLDSHVGEGGWGQMEHAETCGWFWLVNALLGNP